MSNKRERITVKTAIIGVLLLNLMHILANLTGTYGVFCFHFNLEREMKTNSDLKRRSVMVQKIGKVFRLPKHGYCSGIG